MSDIAPVRTMSPHGLALQLGTEVFREWLTYEGKDIIDLPLEYLLRTDPKFLTFWTQRCEEEVVAFRRILDEGDFLDESVASFFSVDEDLHTFVAGDRTMRVWAESRLQRAQEAERDLFE